MKTMSHADLLNWLKVLGSSVTKSEDRTIEMMRIRERCGSNAQMKVCRYCSDLL